MEGDRWQRSSVGESFLDDPRSGVARGVLADLGSHTIDLALLLTSARTAQILHRDVVRDGTIDRKVSRL